MLLGQGSAPKSLVAIALMAVGLSSLPALLRRAERVLPDRPIGSLGLMQVGAGSSRSRHTCSARRPHDRGDADVAFAALAGFALFTLLLNARPPVPPRGAAAES